LVVKKISNKRVFNNNYYLNKSLYLSFKLCLTFLVKQYFKKLKNFKNQGEYIMIKIPDHLDPTKKAFSLFDEFKAFAFKGNVIDLSVGVIIGAAFGKIVDSLVKHIIMPSLAMVLPGEQGYLGWKVVVGAKEIPYGLFLGELVNFVIVALALFLIMVKLLGFLLREKKKALETVGSAAVPPAPVVPVLTKQEELLTEIRDLLKNR